MNIIFCLHDEISSESFESKLKWLMKRYKMVSYDNLKSYLNDEKDMNNCCHLTFDDGWLSTYQVVFPIIKKYNVPITVYTSPDLCMTGKNLWFKRIEGFDREAFKAYIIQKGIFSTKAAKYPVELLLKALNIEQITQMIDEYSSLTSLDSDIRGFINVKELREMDACPLVTIGAHTMHHPILANETAEICYNEIKDSVTGLQELLQKEISFFAYPNGIKGLDFGEREKRILSECGIKYAVSLENGFVSKKSEKLELPRFTSLRRLSFGPLAPFIPSPSNQKGKRIEIMRLIMEVNNR